LVHDNAHGNSEGNQPLHHFFGCREEITTKAQLEGHYNIRTQGFSCQHPLHGYEKQSNAKCYWMKKPSIFYCLVLNNIMTKKRYVPLIIFLYIENPTKESYRVMTKWNK
jgi:hypothetical protein